MDLNQGDGLISNKCFAYHRLSALFLTGLTGLTGLLFSCLTNAGLRTTLILAADKTNGENERKRE